MGVPKQRYCKRGHDTEMFGRYKNSRCKECSRTIPATPSDTLPRLSFGPLEAAMRQRGITAASLGDAGQRAYHRWRHVGVPVYAGDEVACRLGLHPTQIWGAEFMNIGMEEETA